MTMTTTTTMDKPSILRWMRAHRACGDAIKWVEAQDDPKVSDLPRGDWGLWVAAALGIDGARLLAAVMPAVRRALTEYAPAALAAAARAAWAERAERAAEVAWTAADAAWTAADAALAVAAAAWEAAAWEAAEAAAWEAAEAAAWEAAEAAEAAEHRRCADEVRAALPELEQLLAAAVAEAAAAAAARAKVQRSMIVEPVKP